MSTSTAASRFWSRVARSIWIPLVLSLLILATAVWGVTRAPAPVLIERAFASGGGWEHETTVQRTSRIGETTTTGAHTVQTSSRILEVHDDGSASVELRFTTVAVEQGDPPPGAVVRQQVTPTGRVVAAEVVDGSPTTAAPGSAVAFPSHPVRPGDRWETTQQIPFGPSFVTVSVNNTFEGFASTPFGRSVRLRSTVSEPDLEATIPLAQLGFTAPQGQDGDIDMQQPVIFRVAVDVDLEQVVLLADGHVVASASAVRMVTTVPPGGLPPGFEDPDITPGSLSSTFEVHQRTVRLDPA